MKYFKFIVMFILVISIVNLHGLFVLNETEGAFNPPNPCEDCENYTNYNTPSLEQLIVIGAGYFIQSNSDYQLFLKTIEMSDIYGMNSERMVDTINNAIINMEMANETYNLLVATANNLEYNQTVLSALNHFDYYEYLYQNRLNPSVFKQVSQLLKSGDVRGCYQRFYTASLEILFRLRSIKTSMDTFNIPKIAECWRLNQLYLETALFGQYTAEVFMNIR